MNDQSARHELGIRDCPACNQSGQAAIRLPGYDFEEWKLGACKTCRFVYLLNPPETEALVDELAFEKSFWERKAKRRSVARNAAAWARKQLAGFRRRSSGSVDRILCTGRVLDVGCRGGKRLQPPVIPYGIEISRTLFEEAETHMRARGGYCLHTSGSEGISRFESGFFDGILMHSYLEHETEVLPVLKGAHRCLKQDGRLYIRVPNFASINRRVMGRSWCGFRYPDHVNYFTPRSLRAVVSIAGFDVKILNWFRLPVDDNIHALLTKAV